MKPQKKWIKLVLVALLIVTVGVFYQLGLGEYLSFASLKENYRSLVEYRSQNPLLSSALYLGLYILVTALAFPGAAVLTLAGGAIFGLLWGTLLVSIASTIGATLSFLVSRYVLQDFVQNKFKANLERINQGIQNEGAFYLFTLRLVPIFPFFLINLVMGVTSIPTFTFYWISQLGMLPGTVVYVNAGTQLAQLDSIKGILSPELLLSFALIGLFPWLSKYLISAFKTRKHLKPYRKPKHFDYNMVVIGGGSAGLVSSYIAAAVKAKVALVEKHKMGGDCLNTGCVPSKALIRSAKVSRLIKRSSDFGVNVKESSVDFSKVMSRIHRVIKSIEPHDSIERYSKLGVDCLKGTAEILSPYEVRVGDRTLTTKNIVVATGARPLVPAIPGLDKVGFLTSDTVWDLEILPDNLVVLGGGPIGCELAQSFCRLGARVTLIEMASRILSREDEDVSSLVSQTLEKEGVRILTSHKLTRVDSTTNEIVCEGREGEEVRIKFDSLLLALGRRPNTEGFGLEKLGVDIDEKGHIVCDDYMRTVKYPNILACGDVAGPYQFTHTASHQAWYVAVNALFGVFRKFKVDYRVIPWCTFTDPEVARVGLSEDEAKAKNLDIEVTRYGIDDLDRAIADGEASGFVKVITPRGSDKILGATIVGQHAGDVLAEFVIAMKYGLGLNKILGTIHIYPTMAESNKYVAGVWKKAHAPEKLLAFVQRFHRWRRG